jgi:hypothetical protein
LRPGFLFVPLRNIVKPDRSAEKDKRKQKVRGWGAGLRIRIEPMDFFIQHGFADAPRLRLCTPNKVKMMAGIDEKSSQ